MAGGLKRRPRREKRPVCDCEKIRKTRSLSQKLSGAAGGEGTAKICRVGQGFIPLPRIGYSVYAC